MKILFITDNFPPEVNAPATRTYEHCHAWVQAGHEVTVVTGAPNFPHGKVYDGYRNRLYQRETVDGITVVRVWSYIAPNAGFAKRILDYVSFATTAFLAGLFIRTDVIVATSPQFFTTLAGYGLSLMKRRPWVFELRDLWPESIVAVGAMKRGRAIRLLERLEMFLYRRADQIVAVTAAFAAKLTERGVEPAKLAVITNGIDPAKFPPRPKSPDLVRQLDLEDKFVIGYLGTHGMAHGLDFIVRCMAKVDRRDVHCLLIGDGAEKAALRSLLASMALDNVTMLDPVPKDMVARYLSVFDVSLVPLKRSDTFLSVIPSKIFEAAAMHKPILLGVDGQARAIVEEHAAGLYFEPENEHAFLQAVRTLVDDASLRSRLRAGCGRLADVYDRPRLAGEMLELLEDLAQSQGHRSRF